MFLHVFFFLDSFVKITLLFFKPLIFPAHISAIITLPQELPGLYPCYINFYHYLQSFSNILTNLFRFFPPPQVCPPLVAPVPAVLVPLAERQWRPRWAVSWKKSLGGVNHPQTAQLFKWNMIIYLDISMVSGRCISDFMIDFPKNMYTIVYHVFNYGLW